MVDEKGGKGNTERKRRLAVPREKNPFPISLSAEVVACAYYYTILVSRRPRAWQTKRLSRTNCWRICPEVTRDHTAAIRIFGRCNGNTPFSFTLGKLSKTFCFGSGKNWWWGRENLAHVLENSSRRGGRGEILGFNSEGIPRLYNEGFGDYWWHKVRFSYISWYI